MWLIDAMVDAWRDASEEVESNLRIENRLSRGAVLRDDRDFYDHYGIYAGNRCIIHFSNDVIRLDRIEDMKGRTWGYLDVMQFSEELTREITLEDSYRRALSCIGMTGYDLLSNNCEHFAIWCRTGKAISTQAFGSDSGAYGAMMLAGLANIPRFISNIYASNFGMTKSRTISLEYLNDA